MLRSVQRAALVAARPTARRAASSAAAVNPLAPTDDFARRHIAPSAADVKAMLETISKAGPKSYASLDALVADTVPAAIKLAAPVTLPPAASESEALAQLRAIAAQNVVKASYLGQGYYDTLTPGVILRNVLESPGWYTSYTPYQAEVSQGRLESLLNFQTLVVDMTGMDISNASLLDEGTAAAEAMNLAFGAHATRRTRLFVAADVHAQTLDVVRTRASGLGISVVVGDAARADFSGGDFFGVLLQYPNTYGTADAAGVAAIAARAKAAGTLVITATDLLALTLLKAPGALGADICVGSAQRFGVPMGFGGPHAGFLAARDAFKRKMPGRIMGVSIDAQGKRALRMAMQTREQHIRRDKATSNICTAQALLANMAAMYAVYHGPGGLTRIATRVRALAGAAAAALAGAGFKLEGGAAGGSATTFFDTFSVDVASRGLTAPGVAAAAEAAGANVRVIDARTVGLSFDEAKTEADVTALLGAFGVRGADLRALARALPPVPAGAARDTPFLTLPVFNSHHSEHALLRYIHRLQVKDLSLTHSMISLGSCTMKLNATSEMLPVTWPQFANMHPFAPPSQTRGYAELVAGLSADLARITGFAAVSVQPNSGAAGEYAGLMAIRAHLRATGQGHRNVCLIPVSAHGTNPASAVMAGMKVVVVASDAAGNVDLADLTAKAEAHKADLAALMITYPSTYGVFEEGVRDVIAVVHARGGQVYMDGANMNAQVGLTSPGAIGADVCHLNLHKTFCIPHGGGGPGVGAIGVAAHLAPYLPGHPVVPTGGAGLPGAAVAPKRDGAVSSAPFGSALILPISWMYIRMMGEAGLTAATSTAILNANYMAARLAGAFPVLFTSPRSGRVAHEFILDVRPLKAASGGAVDEVDIAKRLMDFGFHAPTMSWPVAGTLMIEPTESEDRAEQDRFCDALLTIRAEIEDVIAGRADKANNVLKNAPHTHAVVTADKWDRPYSREQAAYPGPHAAWIRENKFWPSVGRVDNVHGDRHLHCSCHPISDYA